MNGLGNDFVVVETASNPFDPRAIRCGAGRTAGPGVGSDQLIAISKDDGQPFVRLLERRRRHGLGLRQRQPLRRLALDGGLGPGPGPVPHAGRGAPRRPRRRAPGNRRHGRAAARLATRSRSPRKWTQPLIELQIGPIDHPAHAHAGLRRQHGQSARGLLRRRHPYARHSSKDGPLLEHHPLFPEGVNVGFAQVLSRDHIRLRVWERGAGLTQACGTGACAALVAAVRRGLTDRKATMSLDGGELEIEWRESDGHVLMTGPVALDFTGTLP